MSKLSKMNTLANKLADQDFKYGKLDCYIFTAKLVKEWHGKDFSHLHAVYKSQNAAEHYIEANGGIDALTTGTLGYPLRSTSLAEDGDVVTADVNGDVVLGFVFKGSGLFKMKKSLVKVPLKKCQTAWQVK